MTRQTASNELDPVTVEVSYRRQWDDAFGVRGWKLDIAADDPEVIATTPYTGERIPTSVFIHDMLDHYVAGFSLSGHREEAKALVQLAMRTGSDPTPDYQQMIDEDVIQGRVNGEPLREFLPEELRRELPSAESDEAAMEALGGRLGRGLVRALLTKRFIDLGIAAVDEARASWTRQGLDYDRRTSIGLALQGLFEWADERARTDDYASARGRFELGNDECRFVFAEPEPEAHAVTVSQPVAS